MNLVYIWYIFRLDLVYSLWEQLATLDITRTHWRPNFI